MALGIDRINVIGVSKGNLTGMPEKNPYESFKKTSKAIFHASWEVFPEEFLWKLL